MLVQRNFYYYCNEQYVIIQSKERRLSVSLSLRHLKLLLLQAQPVKIPSPDYSVKPVNSQSLMLYVTHFIRPIKPDKILYSSLVSLHSYFNLIPCITDAAQFKL